MIRSLINLKGFSLIYLILFASFIVRIFPLSFPSLTFDEARIAHRGYILSTEGKDELGRSFPILFNSSKDYQLPLPSYLTALGELVFGKNDFAVRIPFILVGVLLVFIVYKSSYFFSKNSSFNLASALIVAFSPPLVFLSRFPNETILLVFNFMLLFFLVISRKKMFLIMMVMILLMFTSKLSWLILFPFILVTLYLDASIISRKSKVLMQCFALMLVILAFISFLNIPQAKRSLTENNFTIFSAITIKNGIEKMRVQGIASNWPPIVEKVLFNKSEYLIVGIMHWLSHVNPSIYFGQLDQRGMANFSFMGAFGKVLIIPLLSSLLFIGEWGRRKKLLLFSYLIIFTYPSIFMYPHVNLELIVILLPFLSFVIAWGLIHLNKKLAVAIIILMILELLFNMVGLMQERKNTNSLRPEWVKVFVSDVYKSSKTTDIYISDDVVSDIVPFIQWHTSMDKITDYIPNPYKYRQYKIGNMTILGSDEKFGNCKNNENNKFFVSQRDLKKTNYIDDLKIEKTYLDGLGKEVAYELGGRICIQKDLP